MALAACSSSSSTLAATTPSSRRLGELRRQHAGSGGSASAATGGLKTGLKVFVIPKNLGNHYFTTADSAELRRRHRRAQALGETGTETSGTAATAASQIPAIQAAITKGANVAHRVRHRPDRAVPDAEARP